MDNNLIEHICAHFNVHENTIVKHARGALSEYTYSTILTRILSFQSSNTPLTTIFPEMGKDSSSSMLRKAFPGKIGGGQTWSFYILAAASLRRCTGCLNILNILEFGKGDVCKNCRSITYYDTKSNIKNITESGTYYQNNKSKCKERSRQYYNDNMAYYAEYNKHYRENNQAYIKAKQLGRGLAVSQATPPWANIDLMNEIYKNRPEGYHVDHIIPIKGKTVCGLHCEQNLQYLPIAENLSKSNKFDSDTYVHTVRELIYA